MGLGSNETELIGSWVMKEGRMAGDEVSVRTEELIKTDLRYIARSEDGWETLYRDKTDGRYWELTYPRSEMHGGGPMALRIPTSTSVRDKYGVVPDS